MTLGADDLLGGIPRNLNRSARPQRPDDDEEVDVADVNQETTPATQTTIPADRSTAGSGGSHPSPGAAGSVVPIGGGLRKEKKKPGARGMRKHYYLSVENIAWLEKSWRKLTREDGSPFDNASQLLDDVVASVRTKKRT